MLQLLKDWFRLPAIINHPPGSVCLRPSSQSGITPQLRCSIKARASSLRLFFSQILIVLVLLLHCDPSLALSATPGSYVIEIVKSRNSVIVWKGKHLVRVFRASFGRGGKGDKQVRGDKRTPVGTYQILDFNPDSRFHYFMHLNYPNIEDAYYGLKNQVIDHEDFYRISRALKAGRMPPQNTALGGQIGIHGIGRETRQKRRIHDNYDWTEGCIALTNSQIMELKKYVTVGTKVIISE